VSSIKEKGTQVGTPSKVSLFTLMTLNLTCLMIRTKVNSQNLQNSLACDPPKNDPHAKISTTYV